MRHEEIVFILEMALHTKCFLTRVEKLAIQKANVLHVQTAKKLAKEKAAEKSDEARQK